MKKYILLLLIVLQALILRGQTVYQVDPSFNPSWLTSGTVSHTIMLPNGELIVAGNFSINSGPVTAKVAKLGFNGEILFSVNFSTTSSNSINSIDLQSDGKILVAGSFLVSSGAPGNRLVRLNTNGTIDNTLNIGSSTGTINRVKFFGNQIYIAGFFTTYNGVSVRPLIKLSLNGALANDFLFDPLITSSGATVSYPFVYDFDILDDGTLIIGYRVRFGRPFGNTTFSIYIDSFFSNGLSKGEPRILALRDESDITRIKRDKNNFLRIFYNDVFRSSFDGQLISSTFRELGSSFVFNQRILDFLRFENGNRILVGDFTSLGVSRNRIVEIQSNGQVSPLFSNQAGPNNSVSAINIQSNENLILSGAFTTYNGQDVKPIIRLVPQLIDAVPPTAALNPLPRIDSQCLVNFSDLTIPTATDNVDGTIQGTTDESIFPITTQGSTIIT